MTTNSSPLPGYNAYFASDPSVLGVVLEGSSTDAGLRRLSGHEILAGASSDDGLVPVRWRRGDGSTYEHWEDPTGLVIVDPATLADPVPLEPARPVQSSRSSAPLAGTPTVRITLGPERRAELGDPLGRAFIGYRDELPTGQLWDRGRGVWKFRPLRIMETRRALIVHAGIVRLVATVEGVTFHGDRVALLGTPHATDPLVGQPDPLHNESRNPITYGRI